MTKKTLAAGDPIESRCTKCRKITNHIVVAMEGEVPVKVQCNTCDGQHKYYPPAAKKKATAKKPATRTRKTADPKVAEQEEWQTRKADIEAKPATAYAMDTAFKVGSVMKHPKFGLGLVQSSLGPGKVEVLFEDGRKKMRCL